MNKIVMFFCNYDVTCSNVGKKLGIDRKGEIKTFINSLNQMRINENADQVLLTFIGDSEDFLNNIKSLAKEFSEVLQQKKLEEIIILGNHFNHQSKFSCDGSCLSVEENHLATDHNTVIGDKIKLGIEKLATSNKITSVRVARNNIGETITLTNFLKESNISMMNYKFNHFITTLPKNSEITKSKNMMHANWCDLTALNALLSNELGMIRKEKQKQPLMVYRKDI